MIDLYLKTETKDEMITVLKNAGLVEETGEGYLFNECEKTRCVVVYLSDSAGIEVDDDGNEYENLIPVPGFHVNVRTEDSSVVAALQSVTLNPAPDTPKVTWI